MAALLAASLGRRSRSGSLSRGRGSSSRSSNLDRRGCGRSSRSSGDLSRGRGRSSSGGGGRGNRRGGSGGGGVRGGGGVVAGEGEGGARDGVGGEGLVEVEEDTGVGLGVQRGAEGAVGQLGAGAGDLEVDAHGVVLGAVRVLGRVQRDDLMAQHVVARLEGRGDGDVVGEVVGDQVVGRPHAWVGAGDEARGVDLHPGQGRLVDGGRVVGRGDVVDDGAVVLGGMC